MIPSNECYELIENSESCRLRSYQDTGGVWTIGYGHTRNVGPNQIITKATAISLLQADVQASISIINNHCLPCTQSQFDALTDFVFNVGAVQFLNSHLYRYHASGQYDKAAAEFPKWKYDNGKVEPGLVTRRAKEQALYTRQAPVEVHPHIDEPIHSASSVPYPAPAESSAGSSLPSVAPPVPASNTAPVSSSGQSEFLSQALVLIRKLLGKG